MNNVVFSTGMILKDIEACKKYRIISMYDSNIVLCEMEITRLNLLSLEQSLIVTLIGTGVMIIEEDVLPVIFDIDLLPEKARMEYEKKLQIMNEVVQIYSPTYLDLMGKKPKPELKKLLNTYGIPVSTFWKVCVRFFQSGMKEISLVDSRHLGFNKGKSYQFIEKSGKKSEYFDRTGVARSDEVVQYFEEALNEYKSGRQKTLKTAYDYLNVRHYTRIELVNGIQTLVLLPESERPTMRQFYYYVKTHLTQQEKDIIKTSAHEHRNDKRLIKSDSLSGVYGPGDMVEIDACEADVSLVSVFDKDKTVGRPIVYFMIDVYTRIILAVSVAFDNNSILGVTNLFLNLADDKKEYCARYGIGFDDDKLWPSNIVPRRIRVDRGSEFKSKEFGRICIELGIEKQLVPGASGSLKGIVEQSFHQMHTAQNVHLEDHGLIEKRYDSMHHKEATLDIYQYTKMVINFVLTHNQKYNENYPLTREMIEGGVQPIPAVLWQYGINKYGSPKMIPVKEQYIYNLMTPVKAKISRRGISYKDLWYYAENDPILEKEMFRAGTKKLPFDVRIDKRCVDAVYYLRDGRLMRAPLNPKLNGNADYSNFTMNQWDEYRNHKKEMDAKGRIYNEKLSAYSYAVNAGIVDEAKKESYSSEKNLRQARTEEKQEISSRGRMEEHLEERTESKLEKDWINDQEIRPGREENRAPLRKEYSSFEEAFEDL